MFKGCVLCTVCLVLHCVLCAVCFVRHVFVRRVSCAPCLLCTVCLCAVCKCACTCVHSWRPWLPHMPLLLTHREDKSAQRASKPTYLPSRLTTPCSVKTRWAWTQGHNLGFSLVNGTPAFPGQSKPYAAFQTRTNTDTLHNRDAHSKAHSGTHIQAHTQAHKQRSSLVRT